MSLFDRLFGPAATGNEPAEAAVRQARRSDADPMGQTAGEAARFVYGADLSLEAVERGMRLARVERSRAFRRWLGLDRAEEAEVRAERPTATVSVLPERRTAAAEKRQAA